MTPSEPSRGDDELVPIDPNRRRPGERLLLVLAFVVGVAAIAVLALPIDLRSAAPGACSSPVAEMVGIGPGLAESADPGLCRDRALPRLALGGVGLLVAVGVGLLVRHPRTAR